MSTYTCYDSVSRGFDDVRQPLGVDIILGCLARSLPRLSEARLLDAGGGTGQYAQALLPYVGEFELLDANKSMLDVAKSKLSKDKNFYKLKVQLGDIRATPYLDHSFDAIIVNQVFHHLESGADPTFANTKKAIEEMVRILKPNGSLIINTSSSLQLMKGFWFYQLSASACTRISGRFLPLDRLEEEMKAEGMKVVGKFVPLHEVLMGETYFDPSGPLKSNWRKGDSFFALASEEEVSEKLEGLSEHERLEYMKEADKEREIIGQCTLLHAKKIGAGSSACSKKTNNDFL